MAAFFTRHKENAPEQVKISAKSNLPSVLSIAGSDSSGGAGIQADIKTIQALGLFAQTAITAITAQNTLGVTAIQSIDSEIVGAQIDAVFADIRPAAVKVGMVGSADAVREIAGALGRNDAKNIVVDPVMVATSGSTLAADDAVQESARLLFPMACVITPNKQEAEVLYGAPIATPAEAEMAAADLAARYKTAVLLKGGHGIYGPIRSEQEIPFAADDLLVTIDGTAQWYYGERIDNPNTHGTGCTLSSAIASYLALGLSLPRAIGEAKAYLTSAIGALLDLGYGRGPLDHFWKMR